MHKLLRAETRFSRLTRLFRMLSAALSSCGRRFGGDRISNPHTQRASGLSAMRFPTGRKNALPKLSQVSYPSRILLLLTLAMLAPLAQAQRIGVLDPSVDRQSIAQSLEDEAAPPPSLQLRLPPPRVAALPPLGRDDVGLFEPREGQPLAIGIHRSLPSGSVTLNLSGTRTRTRVEGAWQSIPDGRLWRLRITSPGARAMRAHFRDFDIGAGQLWLHSADGPSVQPYTGTGLYGDGEFWSDIVFGDGLTIEYLPDPATTEETVPFQIVEISHIWEDAFGRDEKVDLDPATVATARARTGAGEEVKPLTGPIDVAVGTPSMAGAAKDPPDPETTRVVKEIRSVERSADLQQPVPKAATPISPGSVITFSLGPVDGPTLFSGDNSFQLEVPDSVTRVTVTLESDDPDVDVDLYVRYEEDNDVVGGRIVSDYASTGLTGNEEIVITGESDPPLRAGTYFISIGLFDTDVVAEGTLTATVDSDDTPRPSDGGPLSPGSAVTFSLGPVDGPTLFSGDRSFQVEVLDSATRVTVTLESDDPDVDVDLYVHYEEDNDVVGGRIVSDYASTGLTGNEEIVITGESDPPLRAGTYFISIGLFDTGVVAEGTLTVTVDSDDTPGGSIGGGTLTTGQPVTFSLGPVDGPTLFSGDRSFQVEVPTEATRVVLRLESVDPDVDVDLYVRFDQDPAIENGTLAYDHASQGLTGNERIGITRRSDPPLRAGTYFISIGLLDTDVVAEGNVTATVETDAADHHLDVSCYPKWSNSAAGVAQILFETGEGRTSACSGTLLNNSQEDRTPYFLTAAHCVDSEAEARSVTAFWNYQTQMCNGDHPTRPSLERTVGASLLSTLGSGFIDGTGNPDGDMTLLRLEGDLPDDVVFQGWDADPQPAGTEVAGIHHPGNDDWGVFKRISFGQITSDTTSGGVSADTHAFVSWHPGQGYAEPGSSGSALFSSPGTVVGALSFGNTVEENTDSTGRGAYTHFSVFYPHISQFVDPPPSQSFSIPDRGGQSITSSGTGETVRVGYGGIRADAGSSTPSGIAIFQFRDSEGVLISEAGVPAARPVREGRIFAEVNGPVNTGLAIANPNDGPAFIQFYFTDTSGTRFAEGSFDLGAHEQTAKFLDQPPFNGSPSVLGTLTFTSSLPVAVVALRGFTNVAGEFLMTTLPVAPLVGPPSPFSTTPMGTVYFPHFADGGGWATQVILVNPTDRTITGTVGFLGQGSETEAPAPTILTLDDGRTGSDFDYSIAPRSAQRFTTSNPAGRLAVGSVRATPEGGNAAPSGLVVFSYAQDGKTVSEAGVPALPKGTAFRAYVEASGTRGQAGSIRSGLAITNTAATSNTVALEVTRLDGSLAIAPSTLSLPPSGQVARFLDDIFDSLPDNFAGVLRVTSTTDVAMVALRLRVNERGELKMTTTSPSNEMDPSITEDRFFAHLADSGGWSTQFILFSGTAGQASSGTLSLTDASGNPLERPQ